MQLPLKLTWDLAQNRWAAILNPFLSSPVNGASILSQITLKPGVNVINHLLGRVQQGWFILDQQQALSVYRTQPFNDKTLTLFLGTGFSINPTQTILSTTGTPAGGYLFAASGAISTVAGDVYTNNSQTFTILASTTATNLLFASGTGSPTTSGTLTRTSGTGPASITFVAFAPMASYTPPPGVSALKVTLVGGGGSGGGSGSSPATAGAAAGGGGGGTAIKTILTPATSYYYVIGGGGAPGTAGQVVGNPGGTSIFGANLLIAGPGSGGGESGFAGGAVAAGSPGAGGTATGGDLNLTGGGGGTGLIFSSSSASNGFGGASLLSNTAPGYINTTSQGGPGLLYGGGGAGGIQVSGGGVVAGGAGAHGVLIIDEFYGGGGGSDPIKVDIGVY